LETLTAVAVIVVPMISVQTFWIARGFSSLQRQLGARIDALAARLDRVEQRLDHIVQNHTERITRLEEGS
jgi:predicted PurR-regulated permease PerM